MNGDFHFYGTGTAAMAAGLNANEARVVANAAEFVDYFVGDNYWSNWAIVPDDSRWPDYLFTFASPQLTAQSALGSGINYYHDYWLAFHFPPGNKWPQRKNIDGELGQLQERYLQNFIIRDINASVENKLQLCRPYSQFIIDMIIDTVQMYTSIKCDPHWKETIGNSLIHKRYIGDSISNDTLALIFLGIRMHVLADSWAHQDFSGFNDKSINHINGDVLADVYTAEKLEKAPYSIIEGFASSFFTGGIPGGLKNLDTDVAYAPESGCGHGNFGHYADYAWLNIKYPAAWRKNPEYIYRNNPKQFAEAWCEMASVIALCLNKPADIKMPPEVRKDLTQRFDLSSVKVFAPIESEKCWAKNSAHDIADTPRWKEQVSSPEIGVTHGLALIREGTVWIQDGSILHMYELAAAMHFSWSKRWAINNPDFGWTPKILQ